MRRFLVLCAALFSLAGIASAQGQNNSGIFDESLRTTFPWQLSLGYQYTHFDFSGVSANMNGTNTELVRYFNPKWAAELDAQAFFGRFAPGIYGRSIFYGGGIRRSLYQHKRWEPFVHGDFGGAYLRESASSPFSWNGYGFLVGGGVDWRWRPRYSIRGEADYLGTHVAGAYRSSFNTGVAFVLNF